MIPHRDAKIVFRTFASELFDLDDALVNDLHSLIENHGQAVGMTQYYRQLPSDLLNHVKRVLESIEDNGGIIADDDMDEEPEDDGESLEQWKDSYNKGYIEDADEDHQDEDSESSFASRGPQRESQSFIGFLMQENIKASQMDASAMQSQVDSIKDPAAKSRAAQALKTGNTTQLAQSLEKAKRSEKDPKRKRMNAEIERIKMQSQKQLAHKIEMIKKKHGMEPTA
jgi:hypothetical protein